MNNYTREDILRMVEEEDVGFIRLQFTDMYGTLKNVAITSSQLEKALDNECMFDGSAIEGFARMEVSDMYLRPDLNTFEIFPWRPQQGKVARLLCDVQKADGSMFESDPRYVLKKVIAEAKEMGYTFDVGPECEFFLFHTDEDGLPTTFSHEKASYFDLGPLDLGENARRDIVLTFKLVVKTIAKRHGLHATFMPKPKYNENGSGMHMNMSLHNEAGENVFNDKNDPNGMSKEAYYFIGGLMKHIKAMTFITNPIVNSYKRFVPGFEAPVHIAWSRKNRTPLIRIPADRGGNVRIELRSPDTAANPYLALAVCLAAGLDGIRSKIMPPDSIDRNLFEMSEEELKEAGVEKLPMNLMEACQEFEKDEYIKNVLGNDLVQKYTQAKKKEYEEYVTQVTEWELNKYLHRI